MSLKRTLLFPLLLMTLAGLPQADRIIMTDGTVIKDAKIEKEGLKQVVYDLDGKRDNSVASDNVREIVFERLPELVDEAQAALRDGDAGEALDLLEAYLERYSEKGDRKFAWGPAYASRSILLMHKKFGDLEAVASQAKAFVRKFPDSRYLPSVFLTKAGVEFQGGKTDALAMTLADFRTLITDQGLSERWALEVDLVEARATGGSLEAQRSSLGEIGERAGNRFPSIAGRANVAVGEALLAYADQNASKPELASSTRGEAQGLFETIIQDAKLDDSTLAGAYAGLGECLFYKGADGQDKDALKSAVRALLRVPLLYGNETAYVPKSLYLAGRSFDMMLDTDRKQRMRRELEREYPNSPWTAEAQKHLR